MTELTAQEVPKTRYNDYNDETKVLVMGADVRLSNNGAAGSLASVSASGTMSELMVGLVVFDSGGNVVAGPVIKNPAETLISATVPSVVPLGSVVLKVQFALLALDDSERTIDVAFHPECGEPGICSFTFTP